MAITITITIDDGKETKAQRKERIKLTNNGATTRSRTIKDKKKEANKKASRRPVKEND